MGLGDGPRWQDDYEWVRLADLPAAGRGRRPSRPRATPAPSASDAEVQPYADALVGWLRRAPLWQDDAGTKVLLVDLDNLRAGPVRWRSRMAGVVELAREADHAAFAGQVPAVTRALPWLEEFADAAVPVDTGADAADWALLDAAAAVPDEHLQFVVVSNDHIFARLAERGRVTLLSPGADALSGRLREVAYRIVDLAGLEAEAAAVPPDDDPDDDEPDEPDARADDLDADE